MLRKEHFRRMRCWIEQAEKTFQYTLRRRNKHFKNWSQVAYDYLCPHTGKVIICMLLILIIGVIGAILKRSQMDSKAERTAGERILKQTKNLGSALTKPIISGIDQELDVLFMERKLADILRKDTLNSEDSTFLLQLDEYLNGVSMYQDLPSEDTVKQDSIPVGHDIQHNNSIAE